ncbi:major facilitator superfamily domain-containing protein [Dendryphion nanum]|uniref:Major facilitator superfamily domain-containing protein n=1 Tax=Dendryphion nanum TaxID=256645 RepID=A0A9P9INJ3_9PLEO|nr:major facilitator superfamily domain-containing protein [Dendryphion nanum]
MAPQSSSSSSSSSTSSRISQPALAATEQTPLLSTVVAGPTSEPIETSRHISEQAKLLPESSSSPDPDAEEDEEEEDVPLPKWQIFILCYTKMVDPIAFFSIFPYVNAMIVGTGIAKEDVGFYSGMIESLFSLVQMFTMVFWGKAADRWGRKPSLVLSLFGTAFAVAAFGMSATLWQMVVFRAMAGLFSGTMVTIRAMITENSTKKTQARAFSYFAFAGNIGIFAGPFIGAAFEGPARKFPSTLGRIKFFRDYPYALPGFLTASMYLSAALLSLFFLRETLHLTHLKKSLTGTQISTQQLLAYPGVRRIIVIYQYVLLLAFAFTAVDPVFLYTPRRLGGIEFGPEYIAGAIGLNGVSQALWLLLAFPPLHRRVGTYGVLVCCAWAWPIFFLSNPICALLRQAGFEAAFWTVGVTNVLIGSGVAMAFTASQLAINDVAPTHETLGLLNAIVLSLASGLRAFVPALSTTIYATGVKYHILGGQLFWVLITMLGCGLLFLMRIFPDEARGRGRGRRRRGGRVGTGLRGWW